MDNVRNFVKNLYFILIQICFSQLKYITQHFFQAQETVLPAMRHRSLNNFHKKWDNNDFFISAFLSAIRGV